MLVSLLLGGLVSNENFDLFNGEADCPGEAATVTCFSAERVSFRKLLEFNRPRCYHTNICGLWLDLLMVFVLTCARSENVVD